MSVPEIVRAFASPSERRQRGADHLEWVWDGYLARGAVTLLTGAPKQGKSTLACALSEALAGDAGTFLGQGVVTGPVVYVTEEAAATALEKLHHDDVRMLCRADVWPRPQWAELVEAAGQVAADIGAALVVVDTLPAWAGFVGREENDTGTMQRALEPLMGIARSGVAVLVLAHPPKNGASAARGSGSLAGGVDAIAQLTDGEAKLTTERRLSIVARWSTPEDARIVCDLEAHAWSLVDARERDVGDELVDRVVAAVAEEEGLSQRAVEQKCHGVDNKKVRAALARAVESGRLARARQGRGYAFSTAVTAVHRSPDALPTAPVVGESADEAGATAVRCGNTPEGGFRSTAVSDADAGPARTAPTSGDQIDCGAVATAVTAVGDDEPSTPARLAPCSYPAHRGQDWEGAGGRLVCGVCHPPAGGHTA